MGPYRRTVLATFVALLTATTAVAQFTPLGLTTSSPVAQGQHAVVAYDNRNHVFLHVWDDSGIVYGRVLNVNGAEVSPVFGIGGAAGQSFSNPRVAYSDASSDAFLITFQGTGAGATEIWARWVRYVGTNNYYPNRVQVSDNIHITPYPGAAGHTTLNGDVVYNYATGAWLTVYEDQMADGWHTVVRRVSQLDPPVVQNAIVVSDAHAAPQPPRAAYDFQLNRYLVAWAMVGEAEFGPISGRLLDGATDAPLAPVFTLPVGAGGRRPSVGYLPERAGFLVAWTEAGLSSLDVRGAFVPSDPAVAPGAPHALIATAADDDWSGVQYDAFSRLTVVVARGAALPPVVNAALLDANGQPLGPPSALSTTPDTSGPFLPVVGATGFGQVFLSYVTSSGALLDRFSLPGVPPGPRRSRVQVEFSTPAERRTVGTSFVIYGSAIDLAADAGSGVDEVGVTATPAGGGPPILLGTTTQLADNCSRLQPLCCFSHFVPCQFTINATGLTPGVSYTLAGRVHSTVTGAWVSAGSLHITIASRGPADLEPLGPTTLGTARSAGRTAVAYDDKNDVVLQVWEDATLSLSGRFVHSDGTVAGSAFTIASPTAAGGWIYFPAVAYSRGSNDRVFFVAFTERQPSSIATSYGQIVRYVAADPAGAPLLGARFPLSADANTYMSDVAFNPVTRSFLAAWTYESRDAWVRPFSTDGVPMGAAVNVSDDGVWIPNYFARGLSPRVTVDWRRNRYAVEFRRLNGYSGMSGFGVCMRVLDGATAQPLGKTIWLSGFWDLDIAAVYLPSAEAALMTWTERLCIGCLPETLPGPQNGRLISTDPAVAPGTLLPLMQDVGGLGIDYDPVSNLVLTTAHGTSGGNVAAILDASGNMLSETFVLPGAPPTAVDAMSVRAMSGGLFALAYVTSGNVTLQRVRLTAAGTPGPRFSDVRSHLDGPSDGATLGRSFDVMGWALDLATGAGTGVDAVHVWAYPAAGGTAIFLGAATAPVSRPDLGTAFGAQFTDSGFQVHAAGVPAGTYSLVAYAHSAVSGAFSPLPAATITVASRPAMYLDEPATGATRPSGFDLGGWAIDLSADAGQNGIDVMHVWAYPSAGGAAVFLGVAPVDRPRADIAAIYGAQFGHAGFRLTTAALAPGPYTIVAYAHSTVTDAFSASQAASITVRLPGDPVMTIDTPADGGSTAQPFVLAGWAIDRDAASGPGVDVLHVWAFPTDGGAAVFAGAAATGGARGDVAAIFGPQFAASGYSLALSGLTPGKTYQITVYAHSTVTGTFSQSHVVLVTIAP